MGVRIVPIVQMSDPASETAPMRVYFVFFLFFLTYIRCINVFADFTLKWFIVDFKE